MLWSFHKNGRQLTCEIRSGAEAGSFELVIHEPDGSETIERFDDGDAVDRRAHELQQRLVNDGWWLASDPRR